MSKLAFELLVKLVNHLNLKKGSIRTVEVTADNGYQYEVTIKPIYKYDAAPVKVKTDHWYGRPEW